jgi:RND family efflux transporter MFP subunit
MMWLLAPALFAALLAGCRTRTPRARPAAPAEPSPTPEPAGDPLAPAPATPSFLGLVVAQESVEISARRAGHVEKVLVALGQRVASGTLLATLDARSARKDVMMAQATAGAAGAQVHKAAAELKEAQDRFSRLRRLGKNLVSAEELTSMALKVRAAQSQLATARASLEEQRARQGQLDDSVSDTELRAPFDGKVAARYLDVGAVVAVGTPVLRLISDRELTVRFAVPAGQAAGLEPSAPIVALRDPPGPPLPGVITSVAPEVDSSSGMLFAEARLTPPADGASAPPSGTVVRVRLRDRAGSP